MKIHPLADQFPRMLPDEFDAMVEDIKKHGLLNPIWTYRGTILDGAHRYRASKAAGVRPVFKEIDGMAPDEFVISQNVMRRHLSQAQRAMLLAPTYEGAKGKGGNAARELAGKFSIGESTIMRAASIMRRHPDLGAQVLSGSMEMTEAEDIANRRDLRDLDGREGHIISKPIKSVKPSLSWMDTWMRQLHEVKNAAMKGTYTLEEVRKMTRQLKMARQAEDKLSEVLSKLA